MRGINSTEKEETSRTVRLRLRGKNTRSSHIIRARTVKRFHLLHQSIPQELMRYEHLQELDPNEVCYERARPRLLIGSDHWELIVSKELLTGDRYEPAASRTELGWVIHGTAPQATISHENDEHVFHLRAENCAQSARHQLEANAIGVSVEPPFCAMMQKEDKKTKTNQMKETVQLHVPQNNYTRGVRSINIEATIGLEFTYSKPTHSVTLNKEELHPRSTRTVTKSLWKIRGASLLGITDEEQCHCCGGDHVPPQCHKFRNMNVNARWEWAKANKICFKCLRNKHPRTECKAKQCGLDGCIHSHHPLLHTRNPVSEASSQNSNDSQETPQVVASASSSTKTGSNVMLKVVPIVITNSNGDDVHTYALLDEGSTISLIEEDLAKELNLKGPLNALHIRGINSTEIEETSRTVRLRQE